MKEAFAVVGAVVAMPVLFFGGLGLALHGNDVHEWHQCRNRGGVPAYQWVSYMDSPTSYGDPVKEVVCN